ncbi:MAG: hypothetical protein Q9226_002688 [Calogaya cf. arnoldii]
MAEGFISDRASWEDVREGAWDVIATCLSHKRSVGYARVGQSYGIESLRHVEVCLAPPNIPSSIEDYKGYWEIILVDELPVEDAYHSTLPTTWHCRGHEQPQPEPSASFKTIELDSRGFWVVDGCMITDVTKRDFFQTDMRHKRE